GIPKVNNQLKIRITPPNGSAMTFRPIVVTNSTNTKLEWKGKLLFQGLFDGKHTFQLIENQNGTTTFLHKEEFSGFIIRFFDPQKTKDGFRQLNLALKIQSENQTTIS